MTYHLKVLISTVILAPLLGGYNEKYKLWVEPRVSIFRSLKWIFQKCKHFGPHLNWLVQWWYFLNFQKHTLHTLHHRSPRLIKELWMISNVFCIRVFVLLSENELGYILVYLTWSIYMWFRCLLMKLLNILKYFKLTLPPSIQYGVSSTISLTRLFLCQNKCVI